MGNKHMRLQEPQMTKEDREDWYWSEGYPAAIAKKTGQPAEDVKAAMGMGRGAPGVPRGPRPDSVKAAIARSVAATICEKVAAERQTRLYAYRHLSSLPKAERKARSKELTDLSQQVMLDGVAARYEEAWDVPAGSLRATVGAWKVSAGVELSDDAKAILAQLDAAEKVVKREAMLRKVAMNDAADMTDPIDARFAVQRRPAPKSTDRPAKPITIQQGQIDDGKRRARITEDGR